MATGVFRKIMIPAIIAVLTILIAGGCGNRGGEPGPAADRELVYTVADPTGDWGFPSPYAHYSRGPGYIRMSLIFDTLIWKDERGYIPALAKDWKYLVDENACIFELRDDVTWHDGNKFTAGDVVFTVDYIKKHPFQWFDAGVLTKAEALSEYRVKLYTSGPYAPLLEYFGATLPILPEHIWKDVEEPGKFLEKEALIGTGPFTLADYNREHGTYLYKAYRDYYRGRPKTGQIKFVRMGSGITAAALKQNQVSAGQVPPELLGELEREGYKALAGNHDWVAKMMINHRREPFNNIKFRQALAFAIDRQALVDTCLRGHGLAGSPGLIPPDSPWYNAAVRDQYPHSPEKTAEILTGLGYVKNGSFFQKNGRTLEMELLVSGGETGSPGAPGEREGEMIRAQLEKAGIKVNLRSLEPKALDSRVGDWKFDLALTGHGGMGGDPEMFKRVITAQGFNSARYALNTELNELLEQQTLAVEKEQRQALINKIQQIYAREIPALPLYYPTWYWVHNGQARLYYTVQGIGAGVPLPLNKLSFVS